MLIQLLIEQPSAILDIVKHTPLWVWILFAVLVALGRKQLVDHEASLHRSMVLSFGLALFSVMNLAHNFMPSRWMTLALVVWMLAVGATLLAGWFRPVQSGTRYDPETQRLHIPGSVVPLIMILAYFFLKYGISVELTLQPDLIQSAAFALSLAVLYGTLNGFFLVRSLRLWRLSLNQRPQSVT